MTWPGDGKLFFGMESFGNYFKLSLSEGLLIRRTHVAITSMAEAVSEAIQRWKIMSTNVSVTLRVTKDSFDNPGQGNLSFHQVVSSKLVFIKFARWFQSNLCRMTLEIPFACFHFLTSPNHRRWIWTHPLRQKELIFMTLVRRANNFWLSRTSSELFLPHNDEWRVN